MKTKKTFADRARDIQKKYPYAKNSKVDKESMMDELQVLADEQEAMKEARKAPEGAQGGEQLLATGGYNDPPKARRFGMFDVLGDIGQRLGDRQTELDENVWNTKLNPREYNPTNKEMGIEPLDAVPLTKDEQSRTDLYEKRFGPTVTDQEMSTTKAGDFMRNVKSDIGENPENYANVAAGLSPAVTNYINMKKVGDASRVDPIHEKPVIKPTFFNNEPIQAKLNQGMASASYNLSKQGGDFDNFSKSLMEVNNATNLASGMAEVEGQKINMSQQNLYDKILTDANKTNTAADNQANVDFHQEQIDKNQLKSDYRAGIGQNIGGIFKDIADYNMGKKVGAWTEKWEKIKGIKPNLNKNP
jgi:hypothetical protein